MIRRRERVEIPEFYVGSVIAVTTSDPNSLAANKMVRFVGLVTARGGTGPNAWVNVRNVVDNQGIEFLFDLYSPTLQKIETLKLEKRLDEDLSYLRYVSRRRQSVVLNSRLLIFSPDSILLGSF